MDYRAFTKLMKDKYPRPWIDGLLDRPGAAIVFSLIDLASGYYHVRIAEEDVPYFAVGTLLGLYEFEVLPFGLSNAPATFQVVMNYVFKEQLGKECPHVLR